MSARQAILGVLDGEIRAVFEIDETANQALRDLDGTWHWGFRLWVLPTSALEPAIEALETAGFVVDVRAVGDGAPGRAQEVGS